MTGARIPSAMDSYFRLHRNRLNLLVHILMVPQFVLACFGLVLAVLLAHAPLLILWASVALLSVLGQGASHLFERERPEPFSSPTDFLRRWFAEQFYHFPRFVLTGGWWRAWRGSDHPP